MSDAREVLADVIECAIAEEFGIGHIADAVLEHLTSDEAVARAAVEVTEGTGYGYGGGDAGKVALAAILAAAGHE